MNRKEAQVPDVGEIVLVVGDEKTEASGRKEV